MIARSRIWLSAVVVATLLIVAFAPIAKADPSPALKNVLATLRYLDDASFAVVVQWAKAYQPPPNYPTSPAEQAEQQIGNLGDSDRSAVLSWLRGNGRSALYNQGADDSQIGPPRVGADSTPSPSPTPDPYREIRLTTATLDQTTTGNIQVLGGFALARRDGTSATACISFKVVGPVTATRVVFEFPLLDANGNVLGTLKLDRTGTFSPGIGIMTYSDFGSWRSTTNRGYDSNCATITPGVAALPIIQARYATYRVTHVEFANGTSWPPATP